MSNKKNKTRQIELGALAPTLKKQLRGLVSAEKAEVLDLHANCITRLHLFGLLTCRETDTARKRLIGKIRESVQQIDPKEKGKGE